MGGRKVGRALRARRKTGPHPRVAARTECAPYLHHEIFRLRPHGTFAMNLPSHPGAGAAGVTPEVSAEPVAAGAPTAGFACPVPATEARRVLLAHGGGGRLTHELVERLMLPAFANDALDQRHDSAVLPARAPRLAFTTDAHVVRPLFFPGGDLGTLAVNGTLNDLAMSGARPAALSAAFILEEGLPLETLERIVASMRDAAAAAGVPIVTGDTKVVERGRGDGVFVTTAAVGWVHHERSIGPGSVQAGDAVLFSGDLGRHGLAILATREGLQFESAIESDCASLVDPALALLDAGLSVHCLRDLTRGGAAAALHEIAAASRLSIELDEEAIPIRTEIRAACEILGLEPMQVACEGRFLVIVPAAEAEAALAVLRRCEICSQAAVVGRIRARGRVPVALRTAFGPERILEMGTGEQLPRIC